MEGHLKLRLQPLLLILLQFWANMFFFSRVNSY